MATIVEVISVVDNTIVIAIKRILFVFIESLYKNSYLKLFNPSENWVSHSLPFKGYLPIKEKMMVIF
jgi:hypothetical protein